jgi:hypothetical protein
MADPTLALTFADLIIRVAEYLGVAYYGEDGTQPAQVPVNPHDLELCKRLVNDGYRRFINSHPKGRWNFLTPIITIQFVAGQAVYDLPAGFFGSVLVPWTYDPNGPHRVIGEVPEPTIRAWRARRMRRSRRSAGR